MKNRSRYLTLILIIILFAALFSSGWIIVNLAKQPLNSSSISNDQPKIREIIGKQYLVKETPYFERLSLRYLPNFTDIQSVFNYNNHLIIVGFNRVVEYDPQENAILRQDDGSIPGISGAAMIGENLYLSGDRLQVTGYPQRKQIFKINLETGKIIGTLLENNPRDFVNLNILSKGGLLWAVSWDGFFKINPDNGLLTKIDQEPRLLGLNFIQNYRNQKDFGLQLPTFFAISERINDRYYLFSDMGVYTLERGQFPKQFLKASLHHSGGLGWTSSLITRDEKYAVLITGRGWGGDNPIPDSYTPITIDLMDLENKTINNLLEKNSKLTGLSNIKELFASQYIFLKEGSNNIVILFGIGEKELGKIDLIARRLVIY